MLRFSFLLDATSPYGQTVSSAHTTFLQNMRSLSLWSSSKFSHVVASTLGNSLLSYELMIQCSIFIPFASCFWTCCISGSQYTSFLNDSMAMSPCGVHIFCTTIFVLIDVCDFILKRNYNLWKSVIYIFLVLALGFPKMMSERTPGLKKCPTVEQKS